MRDTALPSAENATPMAQATPSEAGTTMAPHTTPDTEGAEQAAPRGPRNGGRDSGQRGGQRRGPGGNAPKAKTAPKGPTHPVLTQLAELQPTLFGDNAVPLKRGIFQDLMAAHPEVFEKEALKTALGLYTRSTRYLVAMASGQQRHNLQGEPVEVVAPEHRYHALLESYRRRHARTGEDVRQKVYNHILQAAEDAGLLPADYAALVRGKDEAANEILDAAMAELGSRVAREEALLRAFEASAQSVNDFADAYGLHPIEAAATLARAKARAEAAAAAAALAAETAAAAVVTEQATAAEAAPAPAPAPAPANS